MRVIITGDLHLTDRREDQYRWELFNFLRHRHFDALLILGDLTEQKDCHAARFVNHVVEELLGFAEDGKEVHLLMGNHDYTRPDCPFFEFFRHYDNCYYHSTPQIWELGNVRWAFYPHARDPERYWSDMQRGRSLGVQYTLCHQVFNGAVSESGASLEGCDVRELAGAGRVFAGDVHVPQKIGAVEYVGAPYPIRFGDAYKPRLVLIDSTDQTQTYLYPPNIQKLVLEIRTPEDIEYQQGWRAGDQVKIVVRMTRSKFSQWESYRRDIQKICQRNDLVLCGLELREYKREQITTSRTPGELLAVSTSDQFRAYCEHANLDQEDVDRGTKLLEVSHGQQH